MSVAIRAEETHWFRRLGETRSVAIYGIALGILAFWLALPPWDVRFQGGPLALGIGGVLCGPLGGGPGGDAVRLVGDRRRDRRHGGGALGTDEEHGLPRRRHQRGALRRDPPLRDAARLRRDGRHLLGALGGGEHR